MFRGLLSVHSRYGLPVRGVARGDPFHRRLRQFRYLHCRSDCYRLERPLAGWELHPLKIAAFSRRTTVSFSYWNGVIQGFIARPPRALHAGRYGPYEKACSLSFRRGWFGQEAVKLTCCELHYLVVGREYKAQTIALDRDAKLRRSGWNAEQRSELFLAQFLVAPVNAQQRASSVV